MPPKYEVVWPATLGRVLPAGPQPLLDLELRPRNGAGVDVELVAIEHATDAHAARAAATPRVRSAAAASAVVLRTACDLGPDPIVHGDEGRSQGYLSAGAAGRVAALPIDSDDVAHLGLAAATWASRDPDEQTRLALALRWFSRATTHQDPLDRLMDAWIAFETVVKRGQRTGRKRPLIEHYALPAIARILPAVPRAGIEHLLREIYDAERNLIIHTAKAELDETQRAGAAIALSRAVLEDALGLPVDFHGAAAQAIANADVAHRTRCSGRCKP